MGYNFRDMCKPTKIADVVVPAEFTPKILAK
jgi:hypothetical protein